MKIHKLTDNHLYAIIGFWFLVGLTAGFLMGYVQHSLNNPL